MRVFDEADKKKKHKRIEIPENPANLSPEELSSLEATVKAALRDGYIPCPVAWKIARDANVPKIAVGAITDKLGVRMIDCQLGCFKVDKTMYSGDARTDVDPAAVEEIESLAAEKKLTCEKAFELAKKYKLPPMVVGNEASARDIKIRRCQLGCF